MSGAAPLFMVAGIMRGVGSVLSGIQAMQAGNYNAAVARQEGRQARDAAEARAGDLSREGRLLSARQAASYAASGLSLTGTPLDVMAQDAARSELDALRATYQGEVRATGLEAEARLAKRQGRQAFVGSLLTAGGQVASGVARRNAARPRPPRIGTGGGLTSTGVSANQIPPGMSKG